MCTQLGVSGRVGSVRRSVEAMGIEPTNLLHAMHPFGRPPRLLESVPGICRGLPSVGSAVHHKRFVVRPVRRYRLRPLLSVLSADMG